MALLPQHLHLPGRKAVAPRAAGASLRLAAKPKPVLINHTLAVPRRASFTQCGATSADPQQQDVEAMEDATKRWGQQVREGKVKSISTKSAGDMIKGEWTLLDVRPRHEVDTAAVEGAVTVPLFVVDEEASIGTWIKKLTAFGMGGWWEGDTHMKPNEKFISDVSKKIPKDKKVVVACQKGLRSLAASEQLSRAGWQNLAWINGGFETAQKGDLPVSGADDLRYAGIGGLSALLGWTEVQQQTGKGFLGGSNNIIKGAIVVLLLDALWFGYEQATFFLSKSGGQAPTLH